MGELVLKVEKLRQGSWFWFIVLLPVALLVIYILYSFDQDAKRMEQMANELEEEKRKRKRLQEEAEQAAMAGEQEALLAEIKESREKITQIKAMLAKEALAHETEIESIRSLDPDDSAGRLAMWDRVCAKLTESTDAPTDAPSP